MEAMDLGIAGRVAMVAAGSKGIGFATAKRLAEEGCKVSICSRSQQSLDLALAQLPGGTHASVCDVAQAEDLARWHSETVDKLGPADILVTNTGGPPAGAVSAMTDEQWQAGFDSTLLNVIRMVRLVSPSMKERKWGRIVHITSIVAKEPNDLLPISATLRAGIAALVRTQSNEFARYGITCNAVLPGHTLTERQIHLAELMAEQQGISVEQALQIRADQTPVKRLGKPEEIAAAIAYLCSDLAGFTTGINLLVDGGAMRGIA
jgi:3-oxoacyl-[acyl-carrier protein] reductase